MTVRAVDLFCGAGGLTNGLKRAGIQVVAGVDVDGQCAHAYETNNDIPFVQKDVLSYSAAELKEAFAGGEVTLLAGCAPCQPFSTYTQGRAKTHDRWSLLTKFMELVEEVEPDLVTMENVVPLERTERFSDFRARLVRRGYHVSSEIIDCRKYGVAQSRKRLVILASKLGSVSVMPASHPDPCGWNTVRETIGQLRPVAAGETDATDPLHRTSSLSPTNLKRMQASKPGGTWRDWPKDLVAPCHAKKSGRTYPGVYGRMRWDEPAPTITGQCFGFGNGRFGHPEQDRALSLREAALLQSFPPDYVFEKEPGRLGMKAIGRMIGNAVPPRLGEVIGASLKSHVAQAN